MFIRILPRAEGGRIPISAAQYLTLLEGMDAGLVQFDVGILLSGACGAGEGRAPYRPLRPGFALRCIQKASKRCRAKARSTSPTSRENGCGSLPKTHLTDEEKTRSKRSAGFEKLMETLRQRLRGAEGQSPAGGSKWISTSGTYAVRRLWLQSRGRAHQPAEGTATRRAVKILGQARIRKNLTTTVELGTRNIKVALKRLRTLGAARRRAEELACSAPSTPLHEARYLDDAGTPPSGGNAVKLLMFFDVSGSMDDHIHVVEELFSAARAEFRQLEYFYFHNCLYEGLWKDNRRRLSQTIATSVVLHKYRPDYRRSLSATRR